MSIVARLFEVKSYVVVAWDLTAAPPEAARDGGFEMIAMADLATSPAFTESGIPPAERPYDAATRCWIASDGGRLTAWHCLAPETAPIEDWLLMRIEAGGAIWTLGTWVDPDRRGQRLAVEIRHHAAAWARDQGYSKVFGWIRASNRNNLRSARRNGFEPVGRLFVARLGGFGLVRHGRRLRIGRWTMAHPLILPLEIDEGMATTSPP